MEKLISLIINKYTFQLRILNRITWARKFYTLLPTALIFVSSLESIPRYCCPLAVIFFFPLFLNLFGSNPGCNFQHFSSCPFLPQWGHVIFSTSFFIIVMFFSSLFDSFSYLGGYLYTFYKSYFALLPSRWVSCVDTSSILVGLNIKIVWWR